MAILRSNSWYNSKMQWIIYALSSSDGAVRYVGVTKQSMRRRLSAHIYRARRGENTHKDRWIRALLAINELPIATTLEAGEGMWQAAERRWITQLRAQGCDLTNATLGGEGCEGYKHPEHVKRAQSMRRKGTTLSPEHKQAIGTAFRGKSLSEEHREKLKGRKVSDGTRALMSAVQKGRSVSTATLRKMSEARKGIPISERARQSRPKYLSESHRAAISAAIKVTWERRR